MDLHCARNQCILMDRMDPYVQIEHMLESGMECPIRVVAYGSFDSVEEALEPVRTLEVVESSSGCDRSFLDMESAGTSFSVVAVVVDGVAPNSQPQSFRDALRSVVVVLVVVVVAVVVVGYVIVGTVVGMVLGSGKSWN